jgi:hypothetical protein
MTDKLKPDDPEQSKRFKEMAREVEVDERPDAFDRAFTSIVKSPNKLSEILKPEKKA